MITAIPELAAKQISEQLEEERRIVEAAQAAQATTQRLLRAVAGAMAVPNGWRVVRQPDGKLAFEVGVGKSGFPDYQAGHEVSK